MATFHKKWSKSELPGGMRFLHAVGSSPSKFLDEIISKHG